MRARLFQVLLLLLAALVAASCSSHAPRKSSGKATQRAYTIRGKTYQPIPNAQGFSEEGFASWYEPGWFSGKTTANGERLRSGDLTCAHKILPMNTMVRVQNLENGRETTVRVNDRGPFVSGRCIDLTPAGAKALGIYGKGTARVRIAVEGDIPGLDEGRLPGPFYVQLGAFAVRENAEILLGRMMRRGYAGSRMQEGDQSGLRLWRVQAGVFASMEEALAVRELMSVEFPDAFVMAR